MNKMNLMNSGLLVGSLVAVLAVAQPAAAQDATSAPATKPAATSTKRKRRISRLTAMTSGRGTARSGRSVVGAGAPGR